MLVIIEEIRYATFVCSCKSKILLQLIERESLLLGQEVRIGLVLLLMVLSLLPLVLRVLPQNFLLIIFCCAALVNMPVIT
jgi:hypothetical protein